MSKFPRCETCTRRFEGLDEFIVIRFHVTGADDDATPKENINEV